MDDKIWEAINVKTVSRCVPALVLLPVLFAPLPNVGHTKLEIRGYFQSLALIRWGLDSYLVITPEESMAGLHLHSILSMPFVALNFPEGSRFVSLGMALIAVTLIAILSRHLFDSRVALLAPAILWLHPFFVRFASRTYSMSISIALTVATVLSITYYVQNGDRKWFVFSLLLLMLSIMNHTWEATILLPLVVILIYDRRFVDAVLTTMAGLATFGFVAYTTSLQSLGVADKGMVIHSIFYHADLLFAPVWWLGGSFSAHPINVAQPVTLLMSILLTVYLTYDWLRTQEFRSLLLSSWLASGLFIPIFLPRIIVGQYYALWTLLAPVSISTAYLFFRFIPRLDRAIDTHTLSKVATGIIVVFAISNILLVEIGLAAAVFPALTPSLQGTIEEVDPGEAKNAGENLSKIQHLPVSDVVIAGDWGYSEGSMSERGYTRALARVLIYSGLLPTGWTPDESELRFVENKEDATDCKAVVVKTGSKITVERCS